MQSLRPRTRSLSEGGRTYQEMPLVQSLRPRTPSLSEGGRTYQEMPLVQSLRPRTRSLSEGEGFVAESHISLVLSSLQKGDAAQSFWWPQFRTRK